MRITVDIGGSDLTYSSTFPVKTGDYVVVPLRDQFVFGIVRLDIAPSFTGQCRPILRAARQDECPYAGERVYDS